MSGSDGAAHSSLSSSARRVAAFRQVRARPPIGKRERWVIGAVGVHLVYWPWLFGCNWVPAVIGELVLGVAVFGVAVWSCAGSDRQAASGVAGVSPSPRSGAEASDPGYREAWRRLRRFPLFWIGVALLGYLVLQGLNPDWRFMRNAQFWWCTRIKSVGWLPTSIDAPFSRSNVWRQLMTYGDVWLVLCAVWIGITRRKSVRILLGVVTADALMLAGVLGLQLAVFGDRFPWPLTAWSPWGLTASFVNRNQAGAYLDLCVFAALALSLWSLDDAERTLKKSSPAGVLGIAALALVGAVLFTLSRGAVLTLAIALAGFGVWFAARRRKQEVEGRANRKVTLAIAAVFGVFLLVSVRYLDFSALVGRFDALAVERANEPGVSTRLLLRSAAIDMWRAHGIRGVGSGGFQMLFPVYLQHYPEVNEHGQYFWAHAHNDWLEIPIELGLVGDVLIAAGAVWCVGFLVRRKVGWSAVAVPLLFGCSQTLMHAWFDFPFQSPSILGTWCALGALAGKWVELSGS